MLERLLRAEGGGAVSIGTFVPVKQVNECLERLLPAEGSGAVSIGTFVPVKQVN